jgi:hypothetical protein
LDETFSTEIAGTEIAESGIYGICCVTYEIGRATDVNKH